MPLDLPGFYWDESRQRYFPVTTRSTQPFGWQPPPPGPTTSTTAVGPIASPSGPGDNRRENNRGLQYDRRRRLASSWAATPPTSAARERIRHDLTSTSLSHLLQGGTVYSGDFPCSSFHVSQTERHGSHHSIYTGDVGGWLQVCRVLPGGIPCGSSKELYLGSEVTAVCYSGLLRVAVSFGPSSKVAVGNMALDSDMWTIFAIPDKQGHDFRVADFQRSRLAIGAANRGLFFPNIEYSWYHDALNVGSDVFSICQKDDVVYTGARNGSIKAFDVRLNTQRKGRSMFGERFTTDTRSITHLSIVNEWEMIVSTIRGDLELLDLRFARAEIPVTSFHGHVNSYSTKLGLATSPCSSFLFAAGQDNRIRAWSLHASSATQPIEVPADIGPDASSTKHQPTTLPDDPPIVHPLRYTFKDTINNLQAIESGSAGLSLWASSGNHIWRFGIGPERV